MYVYLGWIIPLLGTWFTKKHHNRWFYSIIKYHARIHGQYGYHSAVCFPSLHSMTLINATAKSMLGQKWLVEYVYPSQSLHWESQLKSQAEARARIMEGIYPPIFFLHGFLSLPSYTTKNHSFCVLLPIVVYKDFIRGQENGPWTWPQYKKWRPFLSWIFFSPCVSCVKLTKIIQ